MDLDSMPPSTLVVKCSDCGCSSVMNRSYSGTWFRSVKRKYYECEPQNQNKFVISGFNFSDVARVEIGNECITLREMVRKQRQTIDNLSSELEEERNAASSAANETMSMILRLQREKAEAEMEARQFKRYAEEKMAHDQHELLSLEDLLYKRDKTIESLNCEVQAYKYRMLSYGHTEAEVEEVRGRMSRNNSDVTNSDIQCEFPFYDYPSFSCNLNDTHYPDQDNESIDVEKYVFGETPCSQDQLKDLEYRVNQLDKTPRRNQLDEENFVTNKTLEKVIVGHSPMWCRHSRRFSIDSPSSLLTTVKEVNSDYTTDSPRKLGGSLRKLDFSQAEGLSSMRRVDDVSEIADDMSDRVYTIDFIHPGVTFNGGTESKASVGIADGYTNTPRDSLNYGDFGDQEIKKLYLRLHALEIERESMRQAVMSMRTDESQLVLLKEIAQQLCKDISPAKKTPVRKPSLMGSFSFMSIFKWIGSFVFWRKKARRSKYTFGLSADNAGLLILLERGPRIGRWRCLMRTQI